MQAWGVSTGTETGGFKKSLKADQTAPLGQSGYVFFFVFPRSIQDYAA